MYAIQRALAAALCTFYCGFGFRNQPALTDDGHANSAVQLQEDPDVKEALLSGQKALEKDTLEVGGLNLDINEWEENLESAVETIKDPSPVKWLTSKIKKLAKGALAAVSAAYFYMRDWLIDLCTWAANGGLDSVVRTVKSSMQEGFQSISKFSSKVANIIKKVVDASKVKEMLSQMLQHVKDILSPLLGRKSSESSFLSLDDDAKADAMDSALNKSRADDIKFAAALVKPLIDNTTVIERITDNKYLMLVLGVIIDIIGGSSYALDFAMMMGELLDIAWAPLQAMWLHGFYDGSTMITVIGLFEELLPLTDATPTGTFAWFFAYNGVSEFRKTRKLLQLPDRSLTGYTGCSKTTMKDIASQGYKVMKAKFKGHLYLKCGNSTGLIFRNRKWQKGSCRPKDCEAGDAWCFVNNHCGSRRNPCKKLDKTNPLGC